MSVGKVRDTTVASDIVIVCGLGSLGQSCVQILKKFGVLVRAIALEVSRDLRLELEQELDALVIGDCRQAKVLERAGVSQARSILIVTSDEQCNIATVFAARSQNPKIRIVIRSAQQNLNALLADHLGNLLAFEPTQLPAPALALAALDEDTLGFFRLQDYRLRMTQVQITADHPWCNRRKLHELKGLTRRLLLHIPGQSSPMALRSQPIFHAWDPETIIQAGDRLVYLEATETAVLTPQKSNRLALPNPSRWDRLRSLPLVQLRGKAQAIWQDSSQTQRVLIVCGLVILVLIVMGTLLFSLYQPSQSIFDSFFATATLLLGGFGDLFGGLEPHPQPGWLRAFSLLTAIAGTAFVGVLYALLTEWLLTAKFQLVKRRPPVPKADHVVVIGMGRVGQRTAVLLQEMKQSIVGVSSSDLDATILPEMPLVTGKLINALAKVNLATAKSLLVVTDDEVGNLEIGLMAQDLNPDLNLVIRVVEPQFSQNIARLLPHAKVFAANALSAEAFAAAAFGENILHLLRFDEATVLVTEYTIEANDTLNGLLLAEVAYGYGLLPIWHQSAQYASVQLMPSDEIRLSIGDRLVVLATTRTLRHVERGQQLPKTWQVKVVAAKHQEAQFEGAMAIARVTGCEVSVAQTMMKQLPAIVPVKLYPHQAHHLVKQLRGCQVNAVAVSP
ncbi:MAG: NAD-binding protein [Synechococcales bacterium]|nr:NAD-binding protein [Synechococcales bacterium]